MVRKVTPVKPLPRSRFSHPVFFPRSRSVAAVMDDRDLVLDFDVAFVADRFAGIAVKRDGRWLWRRMDVIVAAEGRVLGHIENPRDGEALEFGDGRPWADAEFVANGVKVPVVGGVGKRIPNVADLQWRLTAAATQLGEWSHAADGMREALLDIRPPIEWDERGGEPGEPQPRTSSEAGQGPAVAAGPAAAALGEKPSTSDVSPNAPVAASEARPSVVEVLPDARAAAEVLPDVHAGAESLPDARAAAMGEPAPSAASQAKQTAEVPPRPPPESPRQAPPNAALPEPGRGPFRAQGPPAAVADTPRKHKDRSKLAMTRSMTAPLFAPRNPPTETPPPAGTPPPASEDRPLTVRSRIQFYSGLHPKDCKPPP
jgi:hypothetical protein